MKHWKEILFGLGVMLIFAFPQILVTVFIIIFLLSIIVAILDKKIYK